MKIKILEKIKRALKNFQFYVLLYKISYDILFYLIVSMVLCLLVESAIPGMVTENNGFLILSVLIFGTILAMGWLGKELGISFKADGHYKALPLVIFLAFILIGNSLLKFSLWENLVITTSTIVVIVLLFQIIFSENKRA